MSLLSLYRAFLHLSLSCCHRNMLNPKVTGESKYTNTKRVTSKKENGCFRKLARTTKPDRNTNRGSHLCCNITYIHISLNISLFSRR